jgi:membrane protein YdbS with pleckstrin-like domain
MTTVPEHSARIASTLREPAHQVSPNAVRMWRTVAVTQLAVTVVVLTIAWLALGVTWWLVLGTVAVLVPQIGYAVWMPPLRNRIHRWEVTDDAVFTRSGWITTELRIAPLSRVQTVDTRIGPLMRMFGLAAVTVTTASAAGPIVIDGLDEEVARRVVVHLTETTAATEGDAT